MSPDSNPSLEQIIVGFTQIDRAIGGSKHESVMQSTQGQLQKATGDVQKSALMMMQLAGALRQLEDHEVTPNALSSPPHQVGSLLQSYLADRALATGRVEPLPVGLEVKFDENDWLGWIGSFFGWSERWLKGRHPLPAPQAGGRVDGNFSMAVLGDWGTGLYGAPACAQSIAANRLNYNIVLHLGDVYYAGTDSEERRRSLSYWPKVPNARNYSLNSNHEMYTGGYGYFDVLLQDARFKPSQTSSYFTLENENFVFLFLDTAYDEHDLTGPEVPWLAQQIAQAGARKVVLFSHHQLFSLLDKQGDKLHEKIADQLAQKKIFAWYWGHEHRCVVYDRHPTFGLYGRCIGHSGYPYFRGDVQTLPDAPGQKPGWKRLDGRSMVPGAIVLDGPNPNVKNEEETYGPNGYLSLLVNGSHLHEIVHNPAGDSIYEADLN